MARKGRPRRINPKSRLRHLAAQNCPCARPSLDALVCSRAARRAQADCERRDLHRRLRRGAYEFALNPRKKRSSSAPTAVRQLRHTSTRSSSPPRAAVGSQNTPSASSGHEPVMMQRACESVGTEAPSRRRPDIPTPQAPLDTGVPYRFPRATANNPRVCAIPCGVDGLRPHGCRVGSDSSRPRGE